MNNNILTPKQTYEKPEVDFISIKCENIICTSGEIFDGNAQDAAIDPEWDI